MSYYQEAHVFWLRKVATRAAASPDASRIHKPNTAKSEPASDTPRDSAAVVLADHREHAEQREFRAGFSALVMIGRVGTIERSAIGVIGRTTRTRNAPIKNERETREDER